MPLGDTLKRARTATASLPTVAARGLWRALTPQMFRYGVLRRALALCLGARRGTVTDEAPPIEALACAPLLVPGRADNIKITRPADLALAAAILLGEETMSA